jgi:hypothetical protein
VTGGWIKLHNNYNYQDEEDEVGRECNGIGEKRNVYRLLVGKINEKGLLGRPRLGWLENTKMDLVEIGWDDLDWIDLAQDKKSGEFLWMR